MVSWCFIRFISSSVSFCCSICLGQVCSGCFYDVGFFRVLTFCFLKCQSYKWDIQPFLSVSQVFVLCIVYNVPAVFVLILLGDFLYIVVYIQNIFDIVPFHCQSCPAAVYFYILNISYLYVRSLKCSGTISLNGFLGLKDYFIICLSGSSTVS